MKCRFLGPLILFALFLFTSEAFGQKATDSSTNLKLARVTQNELNQVAQKLAASEMQQYTYRLYKFGANRAVKPDKQKSVRGLFLMRKPEFMKPLTKGFYDDLQGDLIYFGRFHNAKNQDTSYSLTLGLGGEAIVALDFNNDGVLDGMMGREKNGDLWELRNEQWRAFWRCIDSHSKEGLMEAVGACGMDDGSSDSRGSSRSGRSDWEAFGNALSTPDCNNPNLGEEVRDPPSTEQDEANARKDARIARTEAASEREKNHLAYADALELEARTLDAQADALKDLRNAPTPEAADRARERLIEAGEQHLAALAVVQRERTRAYPPPRTGPRGDTHRPIKPDAESEDPRCKGIRTQIKQGLLFRNKQFCGDDDPIACWERANDAIRDFTHGACHTETGPDDASRIVCEKTEDPLAEPASEPVPGPTDGPALPVIIPREQRVNYSFVGTTPLGAVLAILCQADGGSCGRWEGLKLAKPKL